VCVCVVCSPGLCQLFAERSRRRVPDMPNAAGRRCRPGVRTERRAGLRHHQAVHHHRPTGRRRRLLLRLRVPTAAIGGGGGGCRLRQRLGRCTATTRFRRRRTRLRLHVTDARRMRSHASFERFVKRGFQPTQRSQCTQRKERNEASLGRLSRGSDLKINRQEKKTDWLQR